MLIYLIRMLLLYNRITSTGAILYRDNTLDMDPILLLRLIKSLTLLSSEMDDQVSISKGMLKELEIGSMQISILDHDEFSYVIAHDTLDNEIFARRILDLIINKFHKEFETISLCKDLRYNDGYAGELGQFMETMSFPTDLIFELDPYFHSLICKFDFNLDTLILSDLDHGVVHQWLKPEENDVTEVLLEILSEINVEKNWLAETSSVDDNPADGYNRPVTHEFWLINKVEMTDFTLIARGFYDAKRDRDNMLTYLNEFAETLYQSYVAYEFSGNKFIV